MVSRQRVWQIMRQREGNCITCGQPAVKGKTWCLIHLWLQRLDTRSKYVPTMGRHPTAWIENKPDLSGADWSKTDAALAKQYNTSKGVVMGYRNRHQLPRNPTGRPRQGVALENVNWAQRDKEIALQLSISPSTVRNYRERLGKPKWKAFKKQRQHFLDLSLYKPLMCAI